MGAEHMSHPYENVNLTFEKMGKLFKDAVDGNLELVTEKTDGQSLYLSYSPRYDHALSGLNDTDLKAGGLNEKQLIQRWEEKTHIDQENRAALRDAFHNAFKDWESAVKMMDLDTQQYLFGNLGNYYYTCEVMHPDTANVIDYDVQTLLIHRVKQKEVKIPSGEIEIHSYEKKVRILENYLNSVESNVRQGTTYQVIVNEIKTLQEIEDKTIAIEAIKGLEALRSKYGLKKDDQIGAYFERYVWNEVLVPNLSEIDDRTKHLILRKMMGEKGSKELHINNLKKLIPDIDILAKVKEMVDPKNIRAVLKKARIPLENITHTFAVSYLEEIQDVFKFITNKEEGAAKLQAKLDSKIEDIRAGLYGHNPEEIKKMEELYNWKIGGTEAIKVASEGIVFDFEGHQYKFTGHFAPINQILGMGKYSRNMEEGVLKEQEEIEIEVDDGADVALLPGSFKPPHRGHMSLAQEYSKIADKLIILISDPQKSPRTLPSGDIITPEMSKEIWEIYLSNAGIHNAEAIVSPAPSPIGAVYGYLEELASSSDPIKVILGTSTKGGDDKEKYSAISKYQGTNLDVSSSPLPPLETEQGGIHASDMRKVVDELDIDALEKSFLPSGVSGEEIINIIKSQNPDPFKLEVPEEELEETSTMGSGANVGGPGSVEKRDEDKYMIHREEIIQEISFRKMIRERIKQSMNKSKKPHIIYINERQRRMLDEAHLELVLRRNIRKIIMEASSEVPDYGSTAKNELAALLKQIIPIMEEDYMKLQTSEEQRESFRSHLIVFTIDALNAIKSNESGPETEEEEIEEDINLKVDSPDADKFIDIGMDDEEEIEVSDEEEEAGAALRTLSGHDKTGRNFAVRTFDKINSQIEDTYKALEDPADESEFYDHLITNFKMYFDNFEGKLHAAPEEPTTDRYEKQKTSGEEPVDMAGDEEVPEEAPEDLEAPPEEETLQEVRPKGWSKKKMKRYKKNFPNTKEGESLAFAMAHKQNKK